MFLMYRFDFTITQYNKGLLNPHQGGECRNAAEINLLIENENPLTLLS
jgi:hypothetical protein